MEISPAKLNELIQAARADALSNAAAEACPKCGHALPKTTAHMRKRAAEYRERHKDELYDKQLVAQKDRNDKTRQQASNHYQRWSKAELAIALDPLITSAQAAALTGRTMRAVLTARRAYGPRASLPTEPAAQSAPYPPFRAGMPPEIPAPSIPKVPGSAIS